MAGDQHWSVGAIQAVVILKWTWDLDFHLNKILRRNFCFLTPLHDGSSHHALVWSKLTYTVSHFAAVPNLFDTRDQFRRKTILWTGWDGFRLTQAHCICVLYYCISSISNHQTWWSIRSWSLGAPAILDLVNWSLLGPSVVLTAWFLPVLLFPFSHSTPTPAWLPLVVLEMHSASHMFLHQVFI